MCYYFGDIIKDKDINFSDVSLHETFSENIAIYDISYKASTGPKPMSIRFDIIDGFIRVCHHKFRR